MPGPSSATRKEGGVERASAPDQLWLKNLRLDSLVILFLRLYTPNAGGLSSIPGQGPGFHIRELKDPACHS